LSPERDVVSRHITAVVSEQRVYRVAFKPVLGASPRQSFAAAAATGCISAQLAGAVSLSSARERRHVMQYQQSDNHYE